MFCNVHISSSILRTKNKHFLYFFITKIFQEVFGNIIHFLEDLNAKYVEGL